MNQTKRQVLPAGLWVVATPIGNLGDMTSRAKMALEEADKILCEDTRRTSTLLSALGILHVSHKLQRLDAHTERKSVESWAENLIRELQDGKSFALVTDAGTPGISDPGSVLVAHAQREGVRITPVPGASAVVALLSVSGFQSTAFTFRGFFPRKEVEQKKELETASSSLVSEIFIWFESPHRIRETFKLFKMTHSAVQVVAGKELTKIHEKFFYGTAHSVEEQICRELDATGELGEWCFAVCFEKKEISKDITQFELNDGLGWMKALNCILACNVPASEAAKKVSQEFGISKRVVYEAALKASGKKTEKGG